MNQQVVKACGIMFTSYYALTRCLNILKNNNLIYSQKIKYQTGNLLEELTRNIKKFSIKGYGFDMENVENTLDINIECLEKLVDVLFEGNQVKTHKLLLILDNLKQGKEVYTEEELKLSINGK